MGLLGKLLQLPLAPVAGLVWLAERLDDEARRQLYDPQVVLAELAELEERERRGEITESERRQGEEVLLERLDESRLADELLSDE